MSITAGELITKSDVISYCNQKLTAIKNKIAWATDGTVLQYKYSATPTSGSSTLYTRSAFPENYLDSKASVALLSDSSITDSTMIAVNFYNLVSNTIKLYTRIRSVLSRRYFNNSGVLELKDQNTNTAVLKSSISTVSKGTPENFSSGSEYSYEVSPRITNTTSNVSVINNLKSGDLIDDVKLKTLIDNFYSAWESYYNSNKLTIDLYTCHYNCHTSCYNRARR